MKRLFFTVTFLFVFVFHSYAQLNWDNTLFSISFLQKTDSKERFESRNLLDNIAFGLEVYRNMKDDITDYDISHIIFGITSEDALVDFRKDGFAPVEDSICFSSNSIPGNDAGSEPVLIIIFSASIIVSFFFSSSNSL